MLKQFFMAFNSGLTRLARILVGLAFSLLIITVTIQVLGRSGLFDSPVWTEELTRFALLYMTAFGVGVSYLTGDLVNVDIVCDSLPGRIPWLLKLLSAFIIAALSVALLEPAWRFTKIGALQTSPALGWQMNYIHASVLCLLGFLLLFALSRIGSLLLEFSPVNKTEELNVQ
jgi:TRAP-type C4-dicarboxylate transport system permease small subunit